MKKILKFFCSPLLIIFLLALILRIYQLQVFPFGLHVDEIKVGWNALSILRTGRDDHLNFLSLYYNSFGDFRPTGIFYFTVPSLIAFGRSIFAIRFPSAFFGALTVLPIYLLTNLLTEDKKSKFWRLNTGHFAAFLLAISPWHLEVSRATSEVVISTFFALFALFFYIKLLKNEKVKWLVLSISSIIIAYLLYHAIRFLAPPFYLVIILFYFKGIGSSLTKKYAIFGFIFVVLLTIFFSTTKEGLQRFDQVSIFKDVDVTYEINRIRSEDKQANIFTKLFDNKEVIYARHFLNQYGAYFGSNFLIGNSARPYRYTTPGTGLLNYFELILLIYGLAEIARGKKSYLPLTLLLIAPIPAALTTEDAPNLHRALLMVPFLMIIESWGLIKIVQMKNKFASKVAGIFILAIILNSLFFFYMYFNHSTSHRPFLEDLYVDSPTYRDVGALELASRLDQLKSKYDKIIITNFPDNPYPWYAFFSGIDPKQFNQETYKTSTNERDYENIIFSEEKCPSDNDLLKYRKQNILMVDSWECPYQSQINDKSPLKVVDKILRPDGSEVYILLERDWAKPLEINGVYYD